MLSFNLTTGSVSMASALCSPPLTSFRATPRPGSKCMGNHNNQSQAQNDGFQRFPATKFRNLKAKAAKSNPSAKPNSVICGDCDGNGAVQCSQCKGSGVNSVDFFNGQFKAGDSCWLCGCPSCQQGMVHIGGQREKGKNDMLCGNCNGAGFVGGFLSTHDE